MSDILGEFTERKLRVIFIAVVSTKQGWKNINEVVNSLAIPFETHYCEILDETEYIFSEQSKVFPDVSERDLAKITATKYGKLLVKDNPLGFGGVGVSVVFERSCPNGTLPILWAENKTHNWMPMFKRL